MRLFAPQSSEQEPFDSACQEHQPQTSEEGERTGRVGTGKSDDAEKTNNETQGQKGQPDGRRTKQKGCFANGRKGLLRMRGKGKSVGPCLGWGSGKVTIRNGGIHKQTSFFPGRTQRGKETARFWKNFLKKESFENVSSETGTIIAQAQRIVKRVRKNIFHFLKEIFDGLFTKRKTCDRMQTGKDGAAFFPCILFFRRARWIRDLLNACAKRKKGKR